MTNSVETLLQHARQLRTSGHGSIQTWSPKVFIPLTQLCRDRCHYCTFAQHPRKGQAAYLTRAEVIAIAIAGRDAGCTEALFTLGDRPEDRFPSARAELEALGHPSTLSYLRDMCAAVRDETGLLPHINAGVMSSDELATLRPVAASMGLMLESVSERLCAKGGPHYRSPDKLPARRLETLRWAGELSIPFTTGILIGIGETRQERIDTLDAINELHTRYGHIQEVIVQNFRAKPRTPMAGAPEPDLDDLLWTIATARRILGPKANIQAPPNLSSDDFGRLLDAGINDWGGISPVTPDHVNPERAWPELPVLTRATEAAGLTLVRRLPIYPAFAQNMDRWLDPAMISATLRAMDGEGYARDDRWAPGTMIAPPAIRTQGAPISHDIAMIVERALAGTSPDEEEIVRLFAARGAEIDRVCAAADALRTRIQGETVTYVVNRNINYTNICTYKCGFCAFSKGARAAANDRPYDLDLSEVARRAREAWERGATEVCLQGGIHPSYTGETYLALLHTVREAVPDIHIHAFSPLEIMHGANTLGLSLDDYLARLRDAGLNTLPGTAAEILDDEVRRIICPDKLDSAQWLEVMAAAHRIGLQSTATIMFGHVDNPRHWARHLLRIRDQQQRSGGFTEFVPLPFVHMEAPIAMRGRARLGPTFREVLLMHAIARLALHPHLTSIQASWVKLGSGGVAACLAAGVNDLGGTLMNESISRAAGTQHGQEMSPAAMDRLIHDIGRIPRQRSTTYGDVASDVQARGRTAIPLTAPIQTPPRKLRTAAPDPNADLALHE
ncbi:FO synthase [uncultured Sphingopyxis sp.]|uniref:FO synthase n=3 Tax=Sphingopyxis TaxID=165697 RepID=A0A7W9B8H2_9SPHN|nr:FO synthase [Sphingopyxis panaciterrulae]SBV32557.1 FO synthase [uncultured Sphingopyxis sp.]